MPDAPPVEKEAIDPYVANLIKQTGSSIDKIMEPDPEPEKIHEGPLMMPEPLGSARQATPELTDEQKAAAAKAEDDKAAKAKADADTAAAAEAKKKADEAAPAPVRPVVTIKKVDPVQPARTEVETPDEPTAEQLKKQREDEEYIKTLTPEQQDQIELARYAEANGKAGIYDQTVEFFQKCDRFSDANPEDIEAIEKFAKENKPKWSDFERRKMERKMIADEAAARAREETRKEFEPTAKRLREMEVAPMIQQTLSDVDAILTTADPKNADAIPLDPEVVKAVKGMTYEEAAKQYPDEAKIVHGVRNATEAWLQISNNVTPFNENDPMHAWLATFIAREGANMKRLPKEKQLVEGKQFLPIHELAKLQRENPAAAEGYYTFTDEMIVELIANNGVMDHTNRVKALEKAGWSRQPKQKEVEGNKVTTPPAETSGSPRAGSRAVATDNDALDTNGTLVENFPHLRGIHELKD